MEWKHLRTDCVSMSIACVCVCVCVVMSTFKACTYSPCDWQEAVITNEDNVEDWCGAEQVVHDQPHLAETLTQHPSTRQVVRDVHRDAEGTWNTHKHTRTRTHTHTHTHRHTLCMMIQCQNESSVNSQTSPDCVDVIPVQFDKKWQWGKTKAVCIDSCIEEEAVIHPMVQVEELHSPVGCEWLIIYKIVAICKCTVT